MGLHNKYPNYFYKRGNLFNTYLGYTEPRDRPEPASRPKKKVNRSGPAAKSSATEKPRATSAHRAAAELIVASLSANVSQMDGVRFLEAISTHEGQTITVLADSNVWAHIRSYVLNELDEMKAARYSAELERRVREGEPLVRR